MNGKALLAQLEQITNNDLCTLPVIWADGQQVNDVTVSFEDGAIILGPGRKISKSQPASDWHEAGCLTAITGRPCLCRR